ncbi:Hypp5693 [Branchiostoma lanceolatum]|uniref:Hypp5693 protein n=1 Tax=Branchiostoma lanceolatum TaxID=7740 RepID=A0A8J9YRK0_BRALA|nr:Hypp5693 [Branchiostoma lanceolatum]
MEDDSFECLWLRLRPDRLPRGANSIIVGVLYNPPPGTLRYKPDREVISYLCKSAEVKYPLSGVILMGDTNQLKYQPLCTRCGLKQVVKSPTRGQNQLDSIFTNLTKFYKDLPQHHPPLGQSDHQLLVLPGTPVAKGVSASPPPQETHTCCDEVSWTRTEPRRLKTCGGSPTPHADQKVKRFYSIVRPFLDKTVPLKKGNVTSRDKKWITPRIKQRGRKLSYQKEVKHLKNTDSGKWFDMVKSLIGASTPRGRTLQSSASEKKDMCESLSEHFSSVWSNVHRVIPDVTDVADQLSDGY